MGLSHSLNENEQIILPDGKLLIKAKPVEELSEKDYGMALVEALELQNFFNDTIYGGDNVLYMTLADLKQCALFYYQTKKPTLDHIVNLINGTKNINTFFESIDRLIEMTDILSKFEKLNIFLPGHSPREQLIDNMSNMSSIEGRFIERNYATFMEKLEQLKTESAKTKRFERYFAEWNLYYYRMCPESIKCIEQLKQQWEQGTPAQITVVEHQQPTVQPVEQFNSQPQPQNIINNNVNPVDGGYRPGTSSKNKIAALILAIFLGVIGVHRFYVGKVGTGIIWLLTGGCFAIGWIYDIIKIASGTFRDGAGLVIK